MRTAASDVLVDRGCNAQAELTLLRFSSHGNSAIVRRRIRGAAIDEAPWVVEVCIDGQERYGFWRDDTSATAAALEILGLLAEVAHHEEQAAAASVAAGRVIEADAFGPDRAG